MRLHDRVPQNSGFFKNPIPGTVLYPIMAVVQGLACFIAYQQCRGCNTNALSAQLTKQEAAREQAQLTFNNRPVKRIVYSLSNVPLKPLINSQDMQDVLEKPDGSIWPLDVTSMVISTSPNDVDVAVIAQESHRRYQIVITEGRRDIGIFTNFQRKHAADKGNDKSGTYAKALLNGWLGKHPGEHRPGYVLNCTCTAAPAPAP